MRNDLCSTPFGIIGILTLPHGRPGSEHVVLNAFRHHWNSHLPVARLAMHLYACSTPFGIIGILTFARELALSERKVLNAFRHHWNSHRDSSSRPARFNCAQRLSASLEFSRAARAGVDPVGQGAQRLSASLEFSLYSACI